jgi:hypothetical protein
VASTVQSDPSMIENLSERATEIAGWLADSGFEIREAPAGIVVLDPDGVSFALADLDTWTQLSQHLVPRHWLAAGDVERAIAETGMRVNQWPLGGCRLGIDAAGLLLLYDIEPDAGLESILRAVWMMGVLGRGLLALFGELIESGEPPGDERIEEALVGEGPGPGLLH